MSFFKDMITKGETVRTYEWTVNRFGEVVVYRVVDGKREAFAVETDPIRMLDYILRQAGHAVIKVPDPRWFFGRSEFEPSPSWPEVVELLNKKPRSSWEVKRARMMAYSCHWLQVNLPIDTVKWGLDSDFELSEE